MLGFKQHDGPNPVSGCAAAPCLELAGDAGATGVSTDTELASWAEVRKRPAWELCWDAVSVLSRSAAGLRRALGCGAAETIFLRVCG